jgi:SAM-dependent methyltransferase
MSPAGPFPLYYPGDARRAFGSDEATRRFARVAQLEPGSRVLVLGCGPNTAAVLLARDMGCSVVAADTEDANLTGVRVDLDRLSFPENEFDGVLVQGRVYFPLEASLKSLRRFLAPQGRLGLTYPAKVGRFTAKSALEFWEKRLGAPLLLPRELLLALEAAGYEPESSETLTDMELDHLYREVEQRLGSASAEQAEAMRQEISLHREQNGKAGVSYAFIVGRRREPGEKPPASRDRG